MRPWIRALVMLPFAAMLIFALVSNRAPEPTHHGRSLSFWVEEYRVESQLKQFIHQHEEQAAESGDAITAIGTNGLPFLVTWARYEPPLLGSRFLSWAPLRVSHALDRAFLSQTRVNHTQGAMEALDLLGTNAALVIPELARLMSATKNHAKAMSAALVMSRLGPGALPLMLSAWSNSMPADKSFLSAIIAANLLPNIHSREQLPLLLPILQTHFEPLRSAAYDAVSRIAPDLLTNIPAN